MALSWIVRRSIVVKQTAERDDFAIRHRYRRIDLALVDDQVLEVVGHLAGNRLTCGRIQSRIIAGMIWGGLPVEPTYAGDCAKACQMLAGLRPH